jgi:hypothetical protein
MLLHRKKNLATVGAKFFINIATIKAFVRENIAKEIEANTQKLELKCIKIRIYLKLFCFNFER